MNERFNSIANMAKVAPAPRISFALKKEPSGKDSSKGANKSKSVSTPASEKKSVTVTTLNQKSEGVSMRAVIPQIANEQNRKTLGTWQRQFDFTRTIIGYLLGIHNFFRFPYLCYKYGGIFFVPYIVMMVFVGIPVVFMEFTIGQYCGVGFYVAFTHMAPILSGVSKLLTWSCVMNCWMYSVLMAWIRIYSGDSTSCFKGWEVCQRQFYYNTQFCYTSAMDDDCNDPSINPPTVLSDEMLYYNFACRSVEYYCNSHDWQLIPGRRKCIDSNGKEHSIYERRYHATEEFFYGAVCGLQRKMEVVRRQHMRNIIVRFSRLDLPGIRNYLYVNIRFQNSRMTPLGLKSERGSFYVNIPTSETFRYNRHDVSSDEEILRVYLKYLESKQDQDPTFKNILDEIGSATYQREYWTTSGKKLVEDKDSSSYVQMQELSMTTWIMIGVFLFEDLLKVSFLSYILNAVPFVVLIYVTVIAVSFTHSGNGIQHLFDNNISDIWNLEMWAEAVIQVIYTTGIGNGVLISLATFNNFNHSYMIDLYCTLFLTITTSCCGVLICFCSLGHYLKFHNIDVPFREYIKSESASSVEFCFIVYSHFLTLISERNVIIILFYFMLTSFVTDTAIRLAQNIIDTVASVSPRLKHNSTMILVAVCLMGYLMVVPVMKNGGIVLFIEFEYFTLRYIAPSIILIEAGATFFVYKASRLVDNAEQMGVFSSNTFRKFILASSYISFFAILITIIVNLAHHEFVRFNGEQQFTEKFGWLLFLGPLLMASLTVIKQLIVVPYHRWRWLFIPLMGKDRKLRRAFLRRIQGGKQVKPDRHEDGQTDHEQARAAALRWRTFEAKLLMDMVKLRKEEQEKKKIATFVEQEPAQITEDPNRLVEQGPAKITEDPNAAKRRSTLQHQLNPLLATLVRVAAAAKRDENEDVERTETEKKGSADPSITTNLEDGKKKKRKSFILTKSSDSCVSRIKAAFMGKAMQGGTYYAKRHVGGQGHSRIVNRTSILGQQSMSLSEEEDQHSQDSLSQEEGAEKTRLMYIEFMDYIERWPGRLDESEIESEGSSVELSDIEAQNNQNNEEA